jgi:transcriptional regulator with XRE-family HTH domain
MQDPRRTSKPRWHADYEYFRKRLGLARKASGLTQRDVAAALDRTQSWVSMCERGDRRIDVIELIRFADLYRRPLSYFLPRRQGAEHR